MMASTMWRVTLPRLAPLRRMLSSHPGIPQPPPHPPPTPTMTIPEWPLDGRGEPIKTAKARQLGVNISVQKLNLVARLVRHLTVPEAYRQLAGRQKKASPIIRDVLIAAVRNASAYGFREDRLIVYEAYVTKGVYSKRIRPWHGKGRFGIEHKKYAHLTVIVREMDEELWELNVAPSYMHIQRSGRDRDDSAHPIHQSDKVSWASDMDLGLAIANQNIKALKSQIRTQIRTPTTV